MLRGRLRRRLCTLETGRVYDQVWSKIIPQETKVQFSAGEGSKTLLLFVHTKYWSMIRVMAIVPVKYRSASELTVRRYREVDFWNGREVHTR